MFKTIRTTESLTVEASFRLGTRASSRQIDHGGYFKGTTLMSFLCMRPCWHISLLRTITTSSTSLLLRKWPKEDQKQHLRPALSHPRYNRMHAAKDTKRKTGFCTRNDSEANFLVNFSLRNELKGYGVKIGHS